MPIPQTELNNRKKVRCPFCDNVLGFANGIVDGFQMFCLNKHNTACGRLLQLNVTEKGVEVVEISIENKAREPPYQMSVNQ